MSRRPRWVYAGGHEPDYRFSLANERTFLAWIRTALALLAGGVALDTIQLSLPDEVQRWLAASLATLGLLCALSSWFRWAASERALRRSEPLPAFKWGVLLSIVISAVAITILIAIL